MGQGCSPCHPETEQHRHTGDDRNTTARGVCPWGGHAEGIEPDTLTGKPNRFNIHALSESAASQPSDDEFGYYGSTSNDDNDDSKTGSVTSRLTDADIETAYDGWKKAIEAGNETLATFYFEEYADIDMFQFRWDNGDSALHVAVQGKRARLVFFLLTQGCAVNEASLHSLDTALHYAVAARDEKTVDLLLKWDADAQCMNKKKITPIMLATQLRDQNIIGLLSRAMAERNGRGGVGDEAENEPQFVQQKTNADRLRELQLQMGANGSALEMLRHNESLSLVTGDEYEDETDRGSLSGKNRAQSEAELARLKITANSPFTKLGHPKNADRKHITDIVSAHQKPLPTLEAWLEKKKPGGMVPTYQRRWIVVRGAHMLWSSKQRTITNDADRKERKKFNGAIHLMTIEQVAGVRTNANNKFMVKAKDAKRSAMREYVFRCTNKRERDFWVMGLKEHKKQYQVISSYLGH